jgi:hypothetical protein
MERQTLSILALESLGQPSEWMSEKGSFLYFQTFFSDCCNVKA